MNTLVETGQCHPLGAAMRAGGVNFSIFSQNATLVELLLFDNANDVRPAHVIRLDPARHRTYQYWHAFVPGVKAGQLYGYRAFGPFEPGKGYRFDGSKVLLDPYTRAVANSKHYTRAAACQPGDNCAHALKSVVMDPRGYRWEGDRPLRRPWAETVIYELHVGGFTRHPSSGVSLEKRGTYAGLAEKVPYLKELGVTAVELLPVQQFDEQSGVGGRSNYWGYDPVAFFAPHDGYSSSREPLGPVDEFRDMVKALHRAGIEVILDVVFNHTAEGNHRGPTLSFRGLENRVYYMLQPDAMHYRDYSGCGNTVNGNNSIVRRMILDCLHYWVEQMHVDGFRFDLASVLARDYTGQPLADPPVLWEIETDPVLAGTKIIAEAWDAAGLYQVGSFIGNRWAVWNGQYRDDVRRFAKGDPGLVRTLADRLVGSPDLFPQGRQAVQRTVNFITCHDGFTLNDLVSYNGKHNEANGEDNRDGTDANYSWNCGAEGPSVDPAIQELRTRQMKNLLTILACSQGMPMLLMGDEIGRSQRGNNNAYCQNNETSWLDWTDVETHRELRSYVQRLLRFRREQPVFQQAVTWSVPVGPDAPSLTWHGVESHQPDWSSMSRSLAFVLREGGTSLYIAFNAYWQPLTFELPPPAPGCQWRRVVDTSLPSPADISEPGTEPVFAGTSYGVGPRSVVILLERQA